MHLLVTVLVAAALISQHITVSAQCSPQCSCGSSDGSWSPLYRTLTSHQPSENDIVQRAPPRCSCGCSPRRLPARLTAPPPNTAQHIIPYQQSGISALSGVVMDSHVFQQTGPATVIQTPPAMLFQGDSTHTCDTSSHIMTIPSRQDSSVTFNSFDNPSNTITATDDAPPTVTYCTAPDARPAVVFSSSSDESPTTTYSTTPQQMSCQPPPTNSVIPVPQPNFPQQPPSQPMYFTQPAPLFASCPATLFYPAAPAMTCPQPNFMYPATSVPSYPSVPAIPNIPQRFTTGHSSHITYSTADNTPTTTYSTTPSQDIPCNSPQSIPSTSQSFTTGTFQNTPSNTVTFSTSDVQQTPTNAAPFNNNFQQIPTNAVNLNTHFQEIPTNSVNLKTNFQEIPTNAVNLNNNFHEIPTNSVNFKTNFQEIPTIAANLNTNFEQRTTNDVNLKPNFQKTPTSSVNINTQKTPSNTIFFRDSDSSAGAGTPLPESTGPTVTTQDSSTLTYTLLPSAINKEVMDTNRDCSVPLQPVLV